jgi:nucleotide-binding universal stress UspA family protein
LPSSTETDAPVLFAYDGSEQSREAVEQAGGQLRTGRKAIVLSVWQPLESVPFWGAPISVVPPEMAEQVFKEAEAIAEDGAERARRAGFESEPMVVEGSPVWSASSTVPPREVRG